MVGGCGWRGAGIRLGAMAGQGPLRLASPLISTRGLAASRCWNGGNLVIKTLISLPTAGKWPGEHSEDETWGALFSCCRFESETGQGKCSLSSTKGCLLGVPGWCGWQTGCGCALSNRNNTQEKGWKDDLPFLSSREEMMPHRCYFGSMATDFFPDLHLISLQE